MRAITEFELIQDNDRIMIGVSGGKDSIFLAYAMAMMRQRIKKKFELMAVTVNPMFSDSFDLAPIKDFMQRLDIPHHSFDVDIKGAIDAQGGKDPCYTCAFFRRGAVNRYAKEQGCNKVAYAHHNDDAVETLFMGLLYSGQVHTFTPSTYLDKTDITVIRPLVYFREQEIIDAIQYHQVQPVPSPCPNDGHTASGSRS